MVVSSSKTRLLRRRWVGVVVLLLSVPLANGWAQPVPDAKLATDLSLEQALGAARRASPTLLQAKARVAQAQARLRAAKAAPNPQLALAEPSKLDNGSTGGFDEGILASQTVELFGKRSARVAGAKADISAAQFDSAGTNTTLDYTVRGAYYDALRAGEEVRLAAETLDNARTFAAAATTREQEGDAPRQDVLRAQIEVERAQTALVQAQTDQNIRVATLSSLIGMEDTPLHLNDTLTYTPAPYDEAALADYAFAYRADVQSAQALVASRAAAINAAKAAGKPDAFVEFRRTRLDPTSNGTSVRVGIIMPLFDLGRNRAGVSEAKAAVDEQQATLDETRRTARLEIKAALENVRSTQLQIESFQKSRLANAKELLDMAQTGYNEGVSSYLDLLDARSIYRSEQADYIRALATWNGAQADLQRSLGGGLPVVGGTPNAGTPNTGTPNTGTPNTGTPNAGTPNAGTPNAGTPNAGTPNATTALPGAPIGSATTEVPRP